MVKSDVLILGGIGAVALLVLSTRKTGAETPQLPMITGGGAAPPVMISMPPIIMPDISIPSFAPPAIPQVAQTAPSENASGALAGIIARLTELVVSQSQGDTPGAGGQVSENPVGWAIDENGNLIAAPGVHAGADPGGGSRPPSEHEGGAGGSGGDSFLDTIAQTVKDALGGDAGGGGGGGIPDLSGAGGVFNADPWGWVWDKAIPEATRESLSRMGGDLQQASRNVGQAGEDLTGMAKGATSGLSQFTTFLGDTAGDLMSPLGLLTAPWQIGWNIGRLFGGGYSNEAQGMSEVEPGVWRAPYDPEAPHNIAAAERMERWQPGGAAWSEPAYAASGPLTEAEARRLMGVE